MQPIEHLRELINLTERLLHSLDSIPKNTALDKLIRYFLLKQLNHAMSVVKLDPSPDIILMSRTMIEGLLNLEWIIQEPDERAQLWFDYTYVHDYILLKEKIDNYAKENIDNHAKVSDLDKEKVTSAYQAKNSRFLAQKSKKPHDNYRCGKKLKDIAEECKLEDFYDFYKTFSDWEHWGSASLQYMHKKDDTKISYNKTIDAYREYSLLMASLSLLRITEIAGDHFDLGFETVLRKTLKELEIAYDVHSRTPDC